MKMPAATQDSPLVVVVRNADGRALSAFDFSTLPVEPKLGSALASALRTLYGHTSLETQRQSWRCIRKFVACNEALQFIVGNHVPAEALVLFKGWLRTTGLAGATMQSQFNVILAVLTWCSRNYPDVVSKKLRTSAGLFVREKPKVRPHLEEHAIKSILAACYSDIEATKRKHEMGGRLLSGHCVDDSERELASLLQELLTIGSGTIPTQSIVNRSRNSLSRRVMDAGGLRHLNSIIMLSPVDMFPFYLAILIQTSGNPMAIRDLTRDCVRPHAFRQDLLLICWQKPRSGREQRVDFPAGREWSAPSLIAKLAALNENLVEHAEPSRQNHLFLAYSHHMARIPCFQMFHHLLVAFTDKHQLDFDFAFKDLRRAGAKAHQVKGGSVLSAKKRLNHQSVKTTAQYIDQSVEDERHDRIILRFQGELVKKALSADETSRGEPTTEIPRHRAVDTVFGFTCKDPLGGTAQGSRKGELCEQFQRCATCPGALIVLDDVRVVIKLLGTHKELLAAKTNSEAEGWWPRFEAYYLPTLLILENELLPAISADILLEANAMSTRTSVPRLE
ncbi:hypothetical protein [Massilia pseudoviolaceinigra]|uniref:hypothetical protein n=1 Tax=Massilia pseudoviolaceinigra TaxID=3057165 RepID=UPI002796DBEE|nr:hypothetical protein [Massilia sp. CCM 9206]MDQ1924949.1 hypothetical protein [Massilia sp. CCM 9206]